MSEGVRITGGCQCGAVRYAIHSEPKYPHICHCRMCQKAFGSFFAPLAGGVLRDDFEVTRGTIATFNSSDIAERGFCANCGTPLTFRYNASKWIAPSIGSLDHPERVKPIEQYGVEGRVPWLADILETPAKVTEDDAPERAAEIKATNNQHPDYDTDQWPPEKDA